MNNLVLVDGSFEELTKITLLKTLNYLEVKNSSISVLFTDDTEMRELNKKYRGKDKSTDVLSFSMREGEDFPKTEKGNLGDIVISIDYATRQAKEFEVSLDDEIKRLLVHGCLHLLGYEHEDVSVDVARKMFDKQEEILSLLRDLGA